MLSPEWRALLAGKELLIFDFDGTVADTTPLHAEAFRHVLAPFGIDVDYARIAGMSTRAALRRLAMDAGLDWGEAMIDTLAREKQAAVRHEIVKGLQPLPGVDAFLREVRRRYRLAMVTSGSRDTVLLSIRQLGYEGWFQPLVTADDVACGKPDPEGFLRVLEATGVAADAAIVFEDSEAGFQAAEHARIPCIDAQRLHGKGHRNGH